MVFLIAAFLWSDEFFNLYLNINYFTYKEGVLILPLKGLKKKSDIGLE